jgi:hypothetical protein
MRDLDHWLDLEEPPYDEREFLDGAGDVPDMTPEQQERLQRKIYAAIAAQERTYARKRRVSRALSLALMVGCCLTATALAVRSFGLQPKMSMAHRARAVEEQHDVEAADSADPPPPVNAGRGGPLRAARPSPARETAR